MKNLITRAIFAVTASFAFSAGIAQNAGVNLLVLNSGIVPVGGNGVLQATISATTGTSGQSTPIAAGKINLQVTVPSTLLIAATQSNLPTGWIVRNNDGAVINICNSSATIAVNTVVDLLIDLQGVSSTSGSPTLSGQLSFRTNCNAPGSLSGDNPSDNTGQAGFTVAGIVPVKLTAFNAVLTNCKPVLNWATDNEINTDRFEIERASENYSEWNTAGSVKASGNTFTRAEYKFADNNFDTADKKIFYRLKIFDKDGHHEYSEIIPVFINCKKVNVHVYPNPVQNGSLKVSISGASENIKASLLSASGQLILKSNFVNGTNSINLSNAANGNYILKIDFEDGSSKTLNVLLQK